MEKIEKSKLKIYANLQALYGNFKQTSPKTYKRTSPRTPSKAGTKSKSFFPDINPAAKATTPRSGSRKLTRLGPHPGDRSPRSKVKESPIAETYKKGGTVLKRCGSGTLYTPKNQSLATSQSHENLEILRSNCEIPQSVKNMRKEKYSKNGETRFNAKAMAMGAKLLSQENLLFRQFDPKEIEPRGKFKFCAGPLV
mmetsp:Transcript_4416/g.4949  ORF Transcript_4416/g.4949 Transcript_4416/m.4949 type:complete len:196 (-) Transcript_4416:270-857(-)